MRTKAALNLQKVMRGHTSRKNLEKEQSIKPLAKVYINNNEIKYQPVKKQKSIKPLAKVYFNNNEIKILAGEKVDFIKNMFISLL